MGEKRTSRPVALLAVCVSAVTGGAVARADVTSVEGVSRVVLEEFVQSKLRDRSEVSDSFPGTSEALPIRVAASLVSSDPNRPAAAAGAAQLANPTDLNQPNPEDFAVNLTLLSRSADISYKADAFVLEKRRVLFRPEQIGPDAASGETLAFTGKFFLDGALVFFAGEADADLSEASARVEITVATRSERDPNTVVFTDTIELIGQPGGEVLVTSSGTIPSTQLALSDLSGIVDEFGVFKTLVLPKLEIEFPYNAVLGEEFELRAAIKVLASAPGRGIGVAAVLGAPTDTVTRVIRITNDDAAALKSVNAIRAARDAAVSNPAGAPGLAPPILGGLCGLFGFESALLLSALACVGCLRSAAGRAEYR